MGLQKFSSFFNKHESDETHYKNFRRPSGGISDAEIASLQIFASRLKILLLQSKLKFVNLKKMSIILMCLTIIQSS